MSQLTTKLNGKDLLIGVLIGGVLGAVTALLLAPKSGRELREDISGQYAAIADKTKQLAQTVGSQTSDWVGKAKEAGEHVISEVKSWKDTRRSTGSVESAGEEASAGDNDKLIAQNI